MRYIWFHLRQLHYGNYSNYTMVTMVTIVTTVCTLLSHTLIYFNLLYIAAVEDLIDVEVVDQDLGPPVESPSSEKIGYIGVGIFIAEGAAMLILDLTTIGRDLGMLKRNIKKIIRQFKQHSSKVQPQIELVTSKVKVIRRRKVKRTPRPESAVSMTSIQ